MAVLLFDFDGVIADTLPVEVKYFLPVCKKRNLAGISSEQDLRNSCEENIFTWLPKHGISIPQYMEAFNEFYDILNKEKYSAKPFPGMIELLNETALKNPVYIVTSNIYRYPSEMFSQYKVTGVKGILSGEMESSKVKKINGFKDKYPGDKICFITDTTGDVVEAKNSVADKVIAVTWGWHSRELLKTANADIMADSVSELREYIEGLAE